MSDVQTDAIKAIMHLMQGRATPAKEYAAAHGLEYDEHDDYSLALLYEEDARHRYPKRNKLAHDIAFHALGQPERDAVNL